MADKVGIIGTVSDEKPFVEAMEIGGMHYWWSKWELGIDGRHRFSPQATKN